MTRPTWLGLTGLSTLIAFGFAAPTLTQEAKGKKVALLVGVTEYKSGTFPPLKYTENDVEELKNQLARKGGFDEVAILTSSLGRKDSKAAPTAANIRRELAVLVKGRTKHDTVLIALAGHGIQLEVPDPKGVGESKMFPCFCPADAQVNDTDYKTGKSPTLINLDDLFKVLGGCGAIAKMALIDACRNDARAEARNVNVQEVRVPDGFLVLFSCSQGQRAFETKELGKGHGVFFYHVIDALKGKARDDKGRVTWGRLAEHVTEKVGADVPALIRDGARQTPHEIKNFKGSPPVLTVVPVPATKKGEVAKDSPPAKPPVEDGPHGMKFVVLPAGAFDRGTALGDDEAEDHEKPRHRVRLSRSFWIGTHEVTQEVYEKVLGEKPSNWPGKNNPVTGVTWLRAVDFCNRLSRQEGYKNLYYDIDGDKVTILGGDAYRLPTEAEWEYACRAGSTTRWSFGNDRDKRKAFGLFQGEKKEPAMVGSFEPNAWGLFDMHGNAREWCWDIYERNYEKDKDGATDPGGPKEGEGQRVIRGGSFNEAILEARSSARSRASEKYKEDDIGFRVARTPPK